MDPKSLLFHQRFVLIWCSVHPLVTVRRLTYFPHVDWITLTYGYIRTVFRFRFLMRCYVSLVYTKPFGRPVYSLTVPGGGVLDY